MMEAPRQSRPPVAWLSKDDDKVWGDVDSKESPLPSPVSSRTRRGLGTRPAFSFGLETTASSVGAGLLWQAHSPGSTDFAALLAEARAAGVMSFDHGSLLGVGGFRRAAQSVRFPDPQSLSLKRSGCCGWQHEFADPAGEGLYAASQSGTQARSTLGAFCFVAVLFFMYSFPTIRLEMDGFKMAGNFVGTFASAAVIVATLALAQIGCVAQVLVDAASSPSNRRRHWLARLDQKLTTALAKAPGSKCVHTAEGVLKRRRAVLWLLVAAAAGVICGVSLRNLSLCMSMAEDPHSLSPAVAEKLEVARKSPVCVAIATGSVPADVAGEIIFFTLVWQQAVEQPVTHVVATVLSLSAMATLVLYVLYTNIAPQQPCAQLLVMFNGAMLLHLCVVTALAHWRERDKRRLFVSIITVEQRARELADAHVKVEISAQNAEVAATSQKRTERARVVERNAVNFAAHELRNPLHACTGLLAGIIENAGRSPDAFAPVVEDLHHVYTGLRHMRVLCDDVLESTKLASGKVELRPVATNVEELLRQTAVTFRRETLQEHGSKTVDVDVSVDSSVAMFGPVVVDATRIKQIVGNGLGNACKHAQDGRVRLHALIKRDDTKLLAGPTDLRSPGNWRHQLGSKQDEGSEKLVLRVEVRNRGHGVGKKGETLFQPFERGDEGASGPLAADGAGLGLPIAHMLAVLMNGRVGLHDVDGPKIEVLPGSAAIVDETLVTTEFWLEVPVLLAAQTPRLAQGRSPLSASTSLQTASSKLDYTAVLPTTPASDLLAPDATSLAGAHAFIVDDSRLNIRVLQQMLKSMGCGVTSETDPMRVDAAAVARDAEVTAASAAPSTRTRPRIDAVLLDVVMPGKSGTELCHELRAAGVRIPIVATTGNTAACDVTAYKRGGFSAVLQKPFTAGELHACLRSVGVGGAGDDLEAGGDESLRRVAEA